MTASRGRSARSRGARRRRGRGPRMIFERGSSLGRLAGAGLRRGRHRDDPGVSLRARRVATTAIGPALARRQRRRTRRGSTRRPHAERRAPSRCHGSRRRLPSRRPARDRRHGPASGRIRARSPPGGRNARYDVRRRRRGHARRAGRRGRRRCDVPDAGARRHACRRGNHAGPGAHHRKDRDLRHERGRPRRSSRPYDGLSCDRSTALRTKCARADGAQSGRTRRERAPRRCAGSLVRRCQCGR